jgi:hypothetical protein
MNMKQFNNENDKIRINLLFLPLNVNVILIRKKHFIVDHLNEKIPY